MTGSVLFVLGLALGSVAVATLWGLHQTRAIDANARAARERIESERRGGGR